MHLPQRVAPVPDNPPSHIDPAWLRRRFAMPVADGAYKRGDGPGSERDYSGSDIRPAAVLMPLIERDQGLTVLFTRRTSHLRVHGGQISFPGGRTEPGDATPAHTALRETAEEIGLAADRVEILGFLPSEYTTRSGFLVTPVVGLIRTPFELRPDKSEVEEVFEVPLDFLLDPANHQQGSIVQEGNTRTFHAIPYGEYYIWGVTAGILMNFYWFLGGTEGR
jgi:8-oxo-dGTP pyrophosphatase MutT (NUDIX family)